MKADDNDIQESQMEPIYTSCEDLLAFIHQLEYGEKLQETDWDFGEGKVRSHQKLLFDKEVKWFQWREELKQKTKSCLKCIILISVGLLLIIGYCFLHHPIDVNISTILGIIFTTSIVFAVYIFFLKPSFSSEGKCCCCCHRSS